MHHARAPILGLSCSLLLACGGGGAPSQNPEPPVDCGAIGSTAPLRPLPQGSFGHARGVGGFVYALAAPASAKGSVIVAGAFPNVDSFRSPSIARLNTRGAYDQTFRVGEGFRLAGQGNSLGEVFDGLIHEVVPAADSSGDLYVAGAFTEYDGHAVGHFVRLNCDGRIDSGFAVGSGFNDEVTALAAARDGSGDVYVGGFFTAYKGQAVPQLVRLNRDGSRDLAFVPPATGTVGGIAVARDGSGDIYAYNINTVFRLNADGSLDDGFRRPYLGSFDSSGITDVTSIIAADDGSGDLYIGGFFDTYDDHIPSPRLMRLNSDGSFDTGFDVGTGFDGPVRVMAMAGDGSGDVYVGGEFRSYNGIDAGHIARLNPDGTPDAAFDPGTGFDLDVLAIAVAEDGSGSFFAGGWFTGYDGVGADRVARILADGTMAPEFLVPSRFDNWGFIRSLAGAVDGSGDLYAAGPFRTYNGKDHKGVIRLNGDGSDDPAFVTDAAPNGATVVLPLKDGSGDVYVGGAEGGLARLNPDGSVDAILQIGSGFAGSVNALAMPDDQGTDVYVGGLFSSYAGSTVGHIVRLNGDGSVDSGFATGSGFDDDVKVLAMARDGSGDLYVGGSFGNYDGRSAHRIVRLNQDGTLDTGFAPDLAAFSAPWIEDIKPVGEGSADIYVVLDGSLIRLKSDGTRDETFDPRSAGFTSGGPLLVTNDGSGEVYAGAFHNDADNRLFRFRPDGSVNSSFVGSASNTPWALAHVDDGSGDIYVGGVINYGTWAAGKIVRVRADGSLR